jgi:DNA-binding LacI/PurR family transcriptional regulator
VATTFERANAYKQTLLSHGLPVDDALIHDGSEDAKSFDRLLTLKRPPTAILAGNNVCGFVKASNEQKID